MSTNSHTTNLLNKYQNSILNYFGNHFYLAFMTNKSFSSNAFIDLNRKNHCHAHLRVQKFSISGDFKNWEEEHYIYVTNSIYEDKLARFLTLREDLIISWSQSGNERKTSYVLIIDEKEGKIAELPVEFLLDEYAHKNCKRKESVNFYKTYYLAFDIERFESAFVKIDNSPYYGEFDLTYWHPEFIGNTQYSIHRMDTPCRIAIYDKYGNRCLFKEEFKSLKEAFDTLEKVAAIDISYKTFQRRSITNTPIVTNKGNIVLVSRNKESLPQSFYVKEVETEDPLLGTQNVTNEELDFQEKNYIELNNLGPIIKLSIDIEDEVIKDFEVSNLKLIDAPS